MILFPHKYEYRKDTSSFSNDIKTFSNALVVGKRAVILDLNQKELFFTKGSEYQIKATVARYLFPSKKIDAQALCFPGFNYANWYHVVADLGFQVYQAKQRKLADTIILPVLMQSFGSSYLEFINLFGLKVSFVKHPREAKKISQIICFDRCSGRLSEAIKGGLMNDEINNYLEFLKQSFLNSKYADEADKYNHKIFSTRRGGDSRVYEKVADIEKEYEKNGYQIVYFGGMNVFQQMAVMQNATHLSGFHGANLTNLLFAHRCENVEELITRELSGDFQTIAKFKKANHSRRKLI